MYITGKYWNNYIGDSDDSLTLLEYLANKQEETITLEEVFSDLGLEALDGDFRHPEEPITTSINIPEAGIEDLYVDFYFAINIILDLAAMMLECKKNGSVNLSELSGGDIDSSVSEITIKSTPAEETIIKNVLDDFADNPLEYDLSEMCDEDEMNEMAELCADLKTELFG